MAAELRFNVNSKTVNLFQAMTPKKCKDIFLEIKLLQFVFLAE